MCVATGTAPVTERRRRRASAGTVRPGPIVVGVDRSAAAAIAAERAADLAAERGARLHLVMAVDTAVSYEMVVGTDLFRVDDRTDGEHFLQGVGRRFEALDVTTEVSVRSPAAALIDAADQLGAQTVVIGNRRMQGAGGRMLGSVTIEVLRRATCDVLVVDTTG